MLRQFVTSWAVAVVLFAQTPDLIEKERRARNMIAAGQAAEAAALYREIVASAPEIAGVRVNYAVALLAAGDYPEASEQSRRAKALDPSAAGADALLGAALFLMGRLEESIAPLESALVSQPSDANARHRLAQALLGSGRPREALAHYEQLLASKSFDARDRARAAQILFGAATACREASSPTCVQVVARLEALGNTPALLAYRAESLEAEGRFLGAADQWERARAAAPSDARYRSSHARTLYRAGDFTAAMQVLGSSPAKADDRGLLGHCLLLLARPTEALPHLEAAVSAKPDDAKLRGALGQALLELGRPADAIPHLEAALEEDSDGAAYYRLARAYRLTGRPEAAREKLEAYRRRASEDP